METKPTSNTEDLLDRLSAATDYKAEPVAPIEPEKQEWHESAEKNNTDATEESNVEGTESTPEKAQVDFTGIAAGFIDFFDSVLKVGGERLYVNAILKPGDADLLAELDRTVRLDHPTAPDTVVKSEIEKNPGLADVVLRFEAYHLAVTKAPLSDKEKEMLTGPLSKVIEKHHWLQVGPEAMLVLVVLIVMAPRLAPLFPGFTNVISDSLKKVNL